MHNRFLPMLMLALLVCGSALGVERRHGILVGEILKLDAATKTVVVKTADGADHTIHFLSRTAVHGTQATASGASDTFHGLEKGSKVAVHYSAKGTVMTAHEVDNIGKDGLKATDVTVEHIDRATKTMTVKTAHGTRETFHLTDRAARDTGKDLDLGAGKSAKATVYYSEEAGHKVVHFFKRAV